MLPIVLATANPHKVAELRAIFAEARIPIVGLAELDAGPFTEPAETGATFEENATIKALAYAAQTGRPCLADDSGLEVDALGGAPGVISSHYATGGRETGASRAERDAANNARLLRELEGVPWDDRTARFVCVMALAGLPGERNVAGQRSFDAGLGGLEDRPPEIKTTRGVVHGRIGLPPAVPRGSNGFGYDPLFVLPDGRTTAELSPAEKNAISHRGMAARLMAARIIESGLTQGG